MPTFRVDFEVKSDLVLAADTAPLQVVGRGFTIELRNGESNKHGDPTDLIASVIGVDTTLAESLANFQVVLAGHLDWLALVTQMRFEVVGPKFAMDWDAGPHERDFIAVSSVDSRWPPARELDSEVATSVQELLQADTPAFADVAVRAFRIGLRERSPEDQFRAFWTALEAVVEGSKDKTRVAVSCQKCQASISCTACGTPQSKVPMATQAIARRVEMLLAPEQFSKAFPAMVFLRNKLVHGGSLIAAERELEDRFAFPINDCVELMARLAHRAIMEALAPHLIGKSIVCISPDNYVVRLLRAKMNVRVPHEGPEDHPTPPEYNFGVEVSFNPMNNPSTQIESAGS